MINYYLTIHNIYKYMTVNEIAKILISREPYTLYEKFHLSQRNNENMLIITNRKSNNFIYNGSVWWNSAVKRLHVPPLSDISLPTLKHKLKKHLLHSQNSGDAVIWDPQNFEKTLE